MFCALFLALIYPAPALAFSSHYAFCWLIVPPLPDVLIMSAWIRTSSPFNLLLHALILGSFEAFLVTVDSRKSWCRVFGFLELFRGYGEIEKELCMHPALLGDWYNSLSFSLPFSLSFLQVLLTHTTKLKLVHKRALCLTNGNLGSVATSAPMLLAKAVEAWLVCRLSAFVSPWGTSIASSSAAAFLVQTHPWWLLHVLWNNWINLSPELVW